MPEETFQVVVVGGGPVGLLLGCLLSQAGVHTCVIERRTEPRPHSRAIGVHPPGLACLDAVGVATPLIGRGVRIGRAHAFGARRPVGSVSFARLPFRHRFVLCVPQTETERLLAQRLRELKSATLLTGQTAARYHVDANGVCLELNESPQRIRARFLVGCDGKRSAVRTALGVAFRGAAYAAHFVMADTADETSFGSDAAVFLSAEGLVESFPLPNAERRWVVRVPAPVEAPEPELIEHLVAARTGHRAPAARRGTASGFTAEHYLADCFSGPSWALAGDAAHVVSPIGGQGMNLGFLDAQLLAPLLVRALRDPAASAQHLSFYSRTRRRLAQRSLRRAALYTALGRPSRHCAARDGVLRTLLCAPFAPSLAEVFAMRGLSTASTR